MTLSFLQAIALDDNLTHEMLAGALLAMLGSGIKVWSDQRSDQRAWRHDQQNRKTFEASVTERLNLLDQRTEAAMRLEVEVRSMKESIADMERSSEEIRRISADNNGVLQYLKGRADQSDADRSRRRAAD